MKSVEIFFKDGELVSLFKVDGLPVRLDTFRVWEYDNCFSYAQQWLGAEENYDN